jgi:hypothetical protein
MLTQDSTTLAWIKALDSIIPAICKQLNISPLSALDGGTTTAKILAKTSSGQTVVLKTGPYPDRLYNEATWLTRVGTEFCPRVLDTVPGALLMEYLPVTSSQSVNPFPFVDSLLEHLRELPYEDFTPINPQKFHIDTLIGLEMDPTRHHTYSNAIIEVDEATAHPTRLSLAHGDLYTPNILQGSSGRLWAINPVPHASSQGSDIARWSLDPRQGPGALERLGLLAIKTQADHNDTLAWAVIEAAKYLVSMMRYYPSDLVLQARGTFDTVITAWSTRHQPS